MNHLPLLLRRFRAQQWAILVVTVICVAITLSLGAWQMRRAAYKEHLAAQISQRKLLPTLENTALNASNFIASMQDEATWLQRRATLRGRWLHQHTVFLDNRTMQMSGGQRVGFYVVTPLALEASKRVIWVQRGWVQRDFQDRSKLPVLSTSPEVFTIQGRLQAHVSRAFEMQAAMPAEDVSATARPSRIWQNLPVVDFDNKELLPLALLQTSPEAEKDALLRDWPSPDTGVAKHYGYAFQWFALAALLVILYVWFQLLSPRRASKLQA